ncbi:MAG: alpha-L-arabinofuranosidase C-terminal domain-containing protein [Abditibacteriaceae bacterium]
MITSQSADLVIFADKIIGSLNKPLFGQFIELTDKCINGGLYDPDSPHARPDGLRLDLFEALRELRPTHLRYPGGCAAAYFDWQELVGPKSERPFAKLFREHDQAQQTAFGIPEVWALCEEIGAQLYMAVNAHTQTPEDAANLVEYLNSRQPTKWANLRRSHGREEPYAVKIFGLGNEIYGDWQAGQRTADEYSKWCREAIHQMKSIDPSIEIIACGYGRPKPSWDRKVLNATLEQLDMISLHNYFGHPNFSDNMAASLIMQEMIDQLNVNIDEVLDANLHCKKRPGIALDEWNIWYRMRRKPERCDEIYTAADALSFASLMMAILRNCDTIALANTSMLCNVLGALMTDHDRMVRQTIFYPQTMLHDAHSGHVVQSAINSPTFAARHERFFNGIVDVEKAADQMHPSLRHYDAVPALDALVSVDKNRATISLVNKLQSEPLEVRLHWFGVEPGNQTVSIQRLDCSDFEKTNTLDEPFNIVPTKEEVMLDGALLLPPASLTVFKIEL